MRSAECGVLFQARDQPRHSLQHLPRGFVGERHTENISGRDTLLDHVRNAISDDACLARTCPREDQDRPMGRLYGQLLLRVQRVQIQHCGGV